MKAEPETLAGLPFFAGTIRLLASLILLSFFLTNCTKEKPFRETMFLMGTLVEIVAYPDSQQVRDAVGRAFRRMEKVEAMADPKASDSPLTSLRRGEDADLSSELLQVLVIPQWVSWLPCGALTKVNQTYPVRSRYQEPWDLWVTNVFRSMGSG
jgi:thiamine biosynthesis lipoprotein ApbE